MLIVVTRTVANKKKLKKMKERKKIENATKGKMK